MDEKNLSWDENGVRNAVSLLLRGTNTLFDDIIKNLENHPDFRNLVEAILLQGEDISYVISNPEIARGVMYGIFKNEDGRVKISNRIFESYIYEYLISVNRTRQLDDQLAGYLTAKGAAKGYLLSFCDNQKSPRKDQTVRYKNVEIVEVVVSYRDKNETR